MFALSFAFTNAETVKTLKADIGVQNTLKKVTYQLSSEIMESKLVEKPIDAEIAGFGVCAGVICYSQYQGVWIGRTKFYACSCPRPCSWVIGENMTATRTCSS